MKQATVHLKLSKDQTVFVRRVTPIEAMLLTAEHHRNVGGAPIDLSGDKEAIKDVEDTYIEVQEVLEKDGKKNLVTVKKPDNRTEDQELDRLRAKYGAGKVKSMMTEVREFPKTFEDAVARGTKLSLPSSGALSSTKLV